MPAFVLGNEHISAMLQVTSPRRPGDGFRYYWKDGIHYTSTAEMGQKLMDENYRSVNFRYKEDRCGPQVSLRPREAAI